MNHQPDFSSENWIKELKHIHDSALQECNVLYEDIIKLINSYDKVEILSHLNMLTQYFPKEKPDLNRDLRDLPILEHITGLCLNAENSSDKLSHPQMFGILIKLVQDYFLNFNNMLTFMSAESNKTMGEEELIFAARLIKLINQVTPSKYDFQLEDLFLGVFQPLEDYFIQKYGFSPSESLNFCKKIFEFYEKRVSERFSDSQNARKRACIALEDPINGKIIKEILEKRKVSEEQFLGEYSAFNLFTYVNEVFVFEYDKICNELKIENKEAFLQYLDLFSCEFGDNEKYIYPMDDNIIDIKPIIKFNKSQYFCPVPRKLIHNLPIIFESLLIDEKNNKTKIWDRFIKTRSKYLENKTAEFLKRIFRVENIFTNLTYEMKGECFETDAIVKYDTKVLIFESKSGGFSKAAKRGAYSSLKRDLKNLIYESFSQGKNVVKYLNITKNPVFKDEDGNLVDLNIDLQKTDFFITSVILEDLMSLASNPKKIKQIGLFEENEYPWAIDVFALDLITKHLPIPSVFIHYIKQRLFAIDEDVFSSFDELSFLAWYLEIGNFYVIDEENVKSPDSIFLDNSFVQLFDDHYIYGRNPPILKIERNFVKMIKVLEILNNPGFSDIALALLDLPHENREVMLDQLDRIVRQTSEDRLIHDVTLILDTLPNIGVTLITTFGRESLQETLVSYCLTKKYDLKKNRWLGIGRNVIDPLYIANKFLYIDEEWKFNEDLEKLSRKLKEKSRK